MRGNTVKKGKLLQTIEPSDVRRMSNDELNVLCDELRTLIYDKVALCGGHLASNLGAIEATVALCNVFDFTKDKIVFDVGHQCYAYKALTGRADRFDALRKEGGLSGFPKRSESPFDFYDTGHAGTSVSAAVGIAKARDLKHEDFDVIAFIGDGSFNNGLIYEALNALRILNTRILIILNDNGMSISPTVGSMHEILDALKEEECPKCGQSASDKPNDGAKEKRNDGIKWLESFGLSYIGNVDGNHVDEMTAALKKAKNLLKTQSVLLHIVTKKGKGYEFCEENPMQTHGMSPVGSKKEREYSEILGSCLTKMAAKNDKIVAVTAAMTDALGLRGFFDAYPDRAFDVSICEENAAVLCAALATQGLKPYYAIYSTFLQRSFDEIIHDVCAQDLPVTFCIDRAGISGADGETHQGVFDISYLSLIPNLTIVAPKDTDEFKHVLKWSEKFDHPLAIRYPRSGQTLFSKRRVKTLTQKTLAQKALEVGSWEFLHEAKDEKLTIVAEGERCLTIAMEIVKKLIDEGYGDKVNVVNGRFIKPIDVKMLAKLKSNVVSMEDNVLHGGFGSAIEREILLQDADKRPEKRRTFKAFAYDDRFIEQGSVSSLQKRYGVDAEEILQYVKGRLG